MASALRWCQLNLKHGVWDSDSLSITCISITCWKSWTERQWGSAFAVKLKNLKLPKAALDKRGSRGSRGRTTPGAYADHSISAFEFTNLSHCHDDSAANMKPKGPMETLLDKWLMFLKPVYHYRSQTFAVKTKATYDVHHTSFVSFWSQMRYPPIPAQSAHLCQYAAFLARSLKPSSIPG